MPNIYKSEIANQTSKDAFMALIDDMIGYEIGRTTTIRDSKEAHEVVSDAAHCLMKRRDLPGPDSEDFNQTIEAVRDYYKPQVAECVV